MNDRSELQTDLSNGGLEQRAAAAEQLCLQGSAASYAAVELVRATADMESVSTWAVSALEDLGAPSLDSLESLTELATSNQSAVAYWAVTLLGRLERSGRSSESTLGTLLGRAPDLQVQARAAWALGKIGATSDSTISALKRASKASDKRVARLAGQALTEIGHPNIAEQGT